MGMVAQHLMPLNCTIKRVKMVNCMFYIFYHHFLKRRENFLALTTETFTSGMAGSRGPGNIIRILAVSLSYLSSFLSVGFNLR